MAGQNAAGATSPDAKLAAEDGDKPAECPDDAKEDGEEEAAEFDQTVDAADDVE